MAMGDGNIDIWNSREDAFASAANYLATEGWQRDLPLGNKSVYLLILINSWKV